MLIRATLAATAAAILASPIYAQTMTQSVSTATSAVAAIANGDPLPRGKAEEVGMSSERLADIEKVIKADIEKGRLPGAVIAVARRGKLVYYEAFGFRDKQAGVAMTKDTIFNIASMTKPMVALAALQIAGARQAPGRRSAVEIFSEVRRHSGCRAQRGGRRDHRQSGCHAADHAQAPHDAHVRADLWQSRHHRGAQALSLQQPRRRAGDERC